VTLLSSVGLTNLSWTLLCPSNRLSNFSFPLTNSGIGTSVVQVIDSARTFFSLAAVQGQTLPSTSQLGSIVFTALPGDSAFLPVVAENSLGTKQNGTTVGNIAGQPGTVVVIGPQPLLAAFLGTGSTRMLTIYGNPGTNYQFTYATNLANPYWLPAFTLPMTNQVETFPVNQTAPQIYYRAH